MGITLFKTDRIRSLIVLLLLFARPAYTQDADYYKPGFFRYQNYTYVPNIRTVILENKAAALFNPVINLKSNDRLVLKFDDLNEDPGNYSYRFIHCSADWTPSPLSETEYIDGFLSEQIPSYTHSLATQVPYFHYRLEFPTATMNIRISGNYLLVVFDTADPDKILFTRRFFVKEKGVQMEALIHQATNIDLRFTHQEVDFTASTTLPLRNPYKDLKVQIVQNNRWDIVNKGLKPLFVNDGVMDFNLEEENVFAGTNEFRVADVRTLKFETASMDDMTRDSMSGLPLVILKKDQRRATERYVFQEDIQGNYLIKIYDDRDGDTEGDYVKVRFRLAAPEPFDSSVVYVFGAFNQWNLDTLNRMTWSEKEHSYILETVLKQGYYNYMYLVRGSGSAASAAETEGDRFETSNEYAFYYYWQDPTLSYDRLVGYQVYYSRR